MKELFRICPVCEKQFPKNNKTAYCSDECRETAIRVMRNSQTREYIYKNKKRFEVLQQYVERNNLKRILKKYKPKKRNSTNENA